MKTRSCKSKGAKLQNEVKEIIDTRFPELKEGEDYRSAIMGEKGVDVKLTSVNARRVLPYSIECKYQEKTSIWAWLNQAKENAELESNKWKVKMEPMLIFRRNRGISYTCVRTEVYFDLLRLVETYRGLNNE